MRARIHPFCNSAKSRGERRAKKKTMTPAAAPRWRSGSPALFFGRARFSPHALFFLFTFFLQTRAFAHDLLLNFLPLVCFLRGESFIQPLLEKNFPLCDLALIHPIDFCEPPFLLDRQRLAGGRVGLGETFHGEFVGAFHRAYENPNGRDCTRIFARDDRDVFAVTNS